MVESDLEKTKILQLNDKELLIVSGQTLKCVRIQQSGNKILPPNNYQTLSKKYTFTDAIFVNKLLKKRLPKLPVDSD